MTDIPYPHDFDRLEAEAASLIGLLVVKWSRFDQTLDFMIETMVIRAPDAGATPPSSQDFRIKLKSRLEDWRKLHRHLRAEANHMKDVANLKRRALLASRMRNELVHGLRNISAHTPIVKKSHFVCDYLVPSTYAPKERVSAMSIYTFDEVEYSAHCVERFTGEIGRLHWAMQGRNVPPQDLPEIWQPLDIQKPAQRRPTPNRGRAPYTSGSA